MHIESNGPSYQIKLNTDINTVTEQIRYKSLSYINYILSS